jgi:hypothetical protein
MGKRQNLRDVRVKSLHIYKQLKRYKTLERKTCMPFEMCSGFVTAITSLFAVVDSGRVGCERWYQTNGPYASESFH